MPRDGLSRDSDELQPPPRDELSRVPAMVSSGAPVTTAATCRDGSESRSP
jgi:hypothetical protein